MRIEFSIGAALLCAVLCPEPATAGRLTATEENDSLVTPYDDHYTQGLRLSYLTEPVAAGNRWNTPFDFFARTLGILDPTAPGASRRIEWTVLGQSLFTPINIRATNPDPTDRPYAAWLYTGAAFLQNRPTARGSELENLEVLLGVIGPAALGRQVQNNFHTLIKVNPARGWAYQLRNEPGIMVTYERKWRTVAGRLGSWEMDVAPSAGATVGNVLTYAHVGGTLRIGRHLASDYGPAHVRPSVSGTAWFDGDYARGKVGWSVFVGAQGRAVARNIFLDGNSFVDSRSVPKRVLVWDIAGGASVFYSDAIKVDFSVVQRSKEFRGQRGIDRYGIMSVSFKFW